jgi:nucleotide-binding universal stress UspA family protein
VPGRGRPAGLGPSGRIDTIGVGFEDTEEAREALRAAYALARRAGAALRVLAVVKPRLLMSLETKPDVAGKFGKDVEDVMGEHRVRAEKTAREALAQLGDEAHGEVEGSVGDPADTLIRVSQHVDLLVCGSRSYGPLRAVMLGGVTRRVVTEARCPVIVLPRGVESALEDLLAGERAAAPV